MSADNFERDGTAGRNLFAKLKPELERAFIECAQQNGNCRDVCLGFLAAFCGYMGRHIGLNAVDALIRDLRKVLKHVSH